MSPSERRAWLAGVLAPVGEPQARYVLRAQVAPGEWIALGPAFAELAEAQRSARLYAEATLGIRIIDLLTGRTPIFAE
jgi:hypothetical protein